jgi:hypothetical protein
MPKKFRNLIFWSLNLIVFFTPNKLFAQNTLEEKLQSTLFKIHLLGGENKVLLADKSEFDPIEQGLYFIDRKNDTIQYHPKAWKWIIEKNEKILVLKILDYKEIKVSFSSLTEDEWVGKVLKSSNSYNAIRKDLGVENQEIEILFQVQKKLIKENVLTQLEGLWEYLNIGFEFQIAGLGMASDLYLDINESDEIEVKNNLGKNYIYTFEKKHSSQKNYIQFTHPLFKKSSLHFLHSVNDQNIFLTSSFDGEIKNMQLKKTKDLLENGLGYFFYHKKGAPIPLINHQSYNLIQEVESQNGGLYVRRKNLPIPEQIDGKYPLDPTQISVSKIYLNPGKYVNSDHPEIKAFTAKIMEGQNFTNQHELVKYVIKQCASKLRYGDSELIPNAQEALSKGIGNCIGFTHLPAAVLRNLGIPTRNIRVYNTASALISGISRGESAGDFFAEKTQRAPWIPHYILEVYYPSLNNWVSYDVQSRLNFVNLNSVVLYESSDWDMPKHRSSRPLATDINLMILGFDNQSEKNIITQFPLIKKMDPENIIINEGSLFDIFTYHNPDDISHILYASAAGTRIPFIKDEYDENKWSLLYSSFKELNYNLRLGEKFPTSYDRIFIVDKNGSSNTYLIQDPIYNNGKNQYIFDLAYYQSLLNNVKFIDEESRLLKYATCGDEIMVYTIENGQNKSSKFTYVIRLNARRGLFLDLKSVNGQSPKSLKILISESEKSIKIEDKIYQLVRESICHSTL